MIQGNDAWKGFAFCDNGNLSRAEVQQFIETGMYVMEPKLDGVRVCVYREGRHVQIITRGGLNVTGNFKHVVDQVLTVPVNSGRQKLILDGELVADDFATVQRAISMEKGDFPEVGFYAFDVLQAPQNDELHKMNYLLRHTVLVSLAGLSKIEVVANNDDFDIDPMDMYDELLQKGWEGAVLKRKTSAYVPYRSKMWLRSKFSDTLSVFPIDVDENMMVQCGLWTGPGKQMVYVGSVQVPDEDLFLLLNKDLNIVMEVQAFGVDKNAHLRHAVYKGLRFDVDTVDCQADQLDNLRRF